MNIVVSKCLLGVPCRYDGKSCPVQAVIDLGKNHKLIAVCPETMAGLPVPRFPMEVDRDGYAINVNGQDFTEKLIEQGNVILSMMRDNNCTKAILKSKSPSCGSGKIYDGTFSKTIVDGWGLVAKTIKEGGFKVVSEDNIKELFSR